MSTTRFITIICWIISALALIGLTIFFIFNLNVGFNFVGIEVGSFEPVGTHNVPVGNINSLSIDWISGSVEVRVHDGNEIQITEYARRTLRDSDKLGFSVSDNTLEITFTERRINIGNMPSKQLEVLIPRSLSQNFDNLDITTISGRIYVSGMLANEFAARATSGRINISDIQAETIRLQTVSGNIFTSNIQTQTLTTNTTSGRHELEGNFTNVTARSVSGRIEVTSPIVPESLEARATSGRIYVTVPRQDALSVQYSTTSGRFTSEIPVVTHGGSNAQFNLSTTSGRISIFELP